MPRAISLTIVLLFVLAFRKELQKLTAVSFSRARIFLLCLTVYFAAAATIILRLLLNTGDRPGWLVER